MPKLRITQKNYDQVLKDYKNIKKKMRAEYVVIEQDDTGWVRVRAQSTLSQEDQGYIKKDLAAYENFVEKYKAYASGKKADPRIWKSEQDIVD